MSAHSAASGALSKEVVGGGGDFLLNFHLMSAATTNDELKARFKPERYDSRDDGRSMRIVQQQDFNVSYNLLPSLTDLLPQSQHKVNKFLLIEAKKWVHEAVHQHPLFCYFSSDLSEL